MRAKVEIMGGHTFIELDRLDYEQEDKEEKRPRRDRRRPEIEKWSPKTDGGETGTDAQS